MLPYYFFVSIGTLLLVAGLLARIAKRREMSKAFIYVAATTIVVVLLFDLLFSSR